MIVPGRISESPIPAQTSIKYPWTVEKWFLRFSLKRAGPWLIKRLHIKCYYPCQNYELPMMDEVLGLFRSLGSLDKLTIDRVDLQIYLAPYLDLPESEHSALFPSVKELTISNPWMVGLAKSQHELGIPF